MWERVQLSIPDTARRSSEGGIVKEKALLMVVLIGLVILAGCGGGGATAPTGTPAVPPGGAVSKATATPAAIPRLEVPREYKVTEKTPQFFKEAIEKKTPIAVLFYTLDDAASNLVRTELKEAISDPNYVDKIVYIALDIKDYEKSARLAEEFGVGLIPHLSFINAEGKVVKEYRGYVDSSVIKQNLYNLLQEQ